MIGSPLALAFFQQQRNDIPTEFQRRRQYDLLERGNPPVEGAGLSMMLPLPDHRAWSLFSKLQGELTGFEDAPFGDDPGDKSGGGHVESRIVDCHIFGGDRVAAVDGRHL